MKLRNGFKQLLTIPGIGNILAMTIMLEVGDIDRFTKVGNLVSYCDGVVFFVDGSLLMGAITKIESKFQTPQHLVVRRNFTGW